MSVFKTQWIVLRVGKISEKELFYKVLFRDYGILTVTKKKKTREKPVDIGFHISCEIITHNKKTVHTIGNIKILHFFETKEKAYSEIEAFLIIIWKVQKQLPEGFPHREIYDIFSLFLSQENIKAQTLLLTNLKITQALWNLNDIHKDITTQKILKFIHSSHYKDILRLWKIPEETLKNLEHML